MNPTAAAQISALVLPSDPAGVLPDARLLNPGASAALLASIASIVDQFAPPIQGRAQFTSTKEGAITIAADSDTDFIAAMDLNDGTIVTAAGDAALVLGTGTSPRTIEVWSCVSLADSTQSGSLTQLTASDQGVTTVDVSRCIALTDLVLDTNADLTSLGDLTELASLQVLTLTDCTSLTTITAPNLSLVTVDISGCVALNDVDLSGNDMLEATIDALFTPLVPALEGTILCDGGTNEAPSAASLAERTALINAGWTVTVTP
jgi:hypothetical protein